MYTYRFLTGFICMLAIVGSGMVSSVAAIDVNNFIITNFDVNISVVRNSDRQSVMKVTERITAEFPAIDQNHGLERPLVRIYDGHTTSLIVTSVTDENGTVLPYHWVGGTLRIGEANRYVHGSQTYIIQYEQYNVTRYYADTDKDEWYWDIIGTEWRVPIREVHVQVTIDRQIAGAISGIPQCYWGAAGNVLKCDVVQLQDGSVSGVGESVIYTTSLQNIGQGSGVTIAVGFAKGTFATYQPPLQEKLMSIWVLVQWVTMGVGVGMLGWVIVRWDRVVNRRRDIGTIVPEYLPPDTVSVTTAARIGNMRRSIMTAQLLDLAVRRYIKIYQVKEKAFLRPAEYEIEITGDMRDLRWEEQELLRDTFGDLPLTTGRRLNLKTLHNNSQFFQRTSNNDEGLDNLIQNPYMYDLQTKNETFIKWLRRTAKISFVLAAVLASIPFLAVATIIYAMSFGARSLTDKGVALRRYLKGLKMYIGVAEQERIKMLQSPDGAQKVASIVSGTDDVQLIKLYEKVLPYAVLFGQEKQWNIQLGAYYEAAGVQPSWYMGPSPSFNAGTFYNGIHGLSSASGVASSASSSSGGSSGGGSVGGGGGGGGGGGW